MYGLKKWWHDAHRHAIHTTQRQGPRLKSCLPVPLCICVGLGLPVAALEHSLFGCASESCYLIRSRQKTASSPGTPRLSQFHLFCVGNHLATSASKHYL